MTTTIRRLTAAVVLPAALMFTFAACGDDEGGNDSDNNSSTESNDDMDDADDTESEETETDEAEETETEESEEGGNPPSAGGIPNPQEDPDAFEDYIEQMYVQAGMTPDQADCMAGAFMDNVDVENLDDPSAITEMMQNPELQEAMTACMS